MILEVMVINSVGAGDVTLVCCGIDDDDGQCWCVMKGCRNIMERVMQMVVKTNIMSLHVMSKLMTTVLIQCVGGGSDLEDCDA